MGWGSGVDTGNREEYIFRRERGRPGLIGFGENNLMNRIRYFGSVYIYLCSEEGDGEVKGS